MDNSLSPIKKVRVGITGGTGFLGTRLIELLLVNDYVEIVCLVRKESKNRPITNPKIQLVYGELNDPKSLCNFVKDLDVCVHLAAQVSHAPKQQYYDINVRGIQFLVDSILSVNPACKIINCSSIAAYRIKGLIKVHFSDYAKSKLKGDKLFDWYVKNRGLKGVTIIPGMIYGSGNSFFIPWLIDELKNNKLFYVTGGEKSAPLSYIDDLCDLFVRAIFDDNSIGHKYYGINFSEKGMEHLIKIIAKRMGCEPPKKTYSKTYLMSIAVLLKWIYKFFRIKTPPKLPIRTVDVLSITYDFSEEQKKNNLGWKPQIDMDEGIKRIIQQEQYREYWPYNGC